MDLTISCDEESSLNIRTCILIKTKDGYLFEKSDGNGKEWFFLIGGRVKINESSSEAIKREIKEELNINIDNVNFRCVIESFFNHNKKKFHEICFLYESEYNNPMNLPKNIVVLNIEEMKQKDIKPDVIKDITINNNKSKRIVSK